MIFYLPKFFEYNTVTSKRQYHIVELCDEDDIDFDLCQLINENNTTLTRYRNVTRYYNETELQFSPLRQNFYYKQVNSFVSNLDTVLARL